MDQKDQLGCSDDIEILRSEMEIKFIERERRLSGNLHDLFVSFVEQGISGSKFSAALKASLITVFSPATATAAGIGVASILTLVLAWQSNELLKRQNELINTQNLLQESSRRAGLTVELTEVLNRISDANLPRVSSSDDETARICLQENYGYDFSVPSSAQRAMRSLPEMLLGRVVALSNSFRPYRYLDIDRNDLITDSSSGLSVPMSPERAQLLFALANARIDMAEVAQAGGDFSRTPLGNAQLSGMWINNLKLPASDLNGAILVYSNFSRADLSYSNLVEVNATCGVYTGAKLVNVNMAGGQFMGASFDDAVMQGVNVYMANFKDATFQRADLRGAYTCVDNSPVLLDTKEDFLAEVGQVKVEGAAFGAQTSMGASSPPKEKCEF